MVMREVRCLNCLNRFQVEPKSDVATCPHCDIKYRISWLTPNQPKIRGQA